MMMHQISQNLTKCDIFNDIYLIAINIMNFYKIETLVMLQSIKKWGAASLSMALLLLCMNVFAQPVQLSNEPRHPLSQHAQMLIDPTGKLTIEAVAATPASQWQPLKSHLSLGFTDDVIWLKVVLSRHQASDPQDWYLVLGQTVLKDVRLYKTGAQGGFTKHFGTQTNKLNPREILHRRPTFLIQHDDLEERTYWLRLQSPTAMNTSLDIVQRETLLTDTTKESFFWGILFGGYVIAIIFYIAFWTWTRESVHKNYITYITINFLAALFTGGWPTQFSETVPSQIWINLLGIWIACSITTGTLFSTGFIELHKKNPKINHFLHMISYGMTIFGILLITTGNYRWVMPILQTYTLGLISLLMGLSIYHSFKKDYASRLYLFAFSFFYLGVVGRYLRNISIIEPNFWNENIYQLGAFVHMLLMSIGIFSSYNKLRKDKQQAELRADAEAKLREEQREFLSLVSHEFRTPLTISGASADNLLQQPELNHQARLRVEKILKANQRMTSLMETYLSKERLFMNVQTLNIQTHDLNQLCRLAIADMPDAETAQIQLNCPKNIHLQCDAELIRIALNNLLQNALRYSPKPASVTVQCMAIQKNVYVTVTDEGPGIPDNELKFIFTRYFRGKNSLNLPGAGLGLHLIQTIAMRHGGSITVRNLQGKGCEFCLVLPH